MISNHDRSVIVFHKKVFWFYKPLSSNGTLGIKLTQITDENKNPIDQATHSAFSKSGSLDINLSGEMYMYMSCLTHKKIISRQNYIGGLISPLSFRIANLMFFRMSLYDYQS